MKARKHHHYVLVALRAIDDGYPLAQRIKRMLKYCDRALGLRALFVDWGLIPTPTMPQEQRTTLETTPRLPGKE
jgi:hypothetical protein